MRRHIPECTPLIVYDITAIEPRKSTPPSSYLPPGQIIKHSTGKLIALGQSYTLPPKIPNNNPDHTTNASKHLSPSTRHPIPPLTTTPHHHATILFTTYWTSNPLLRSLVLHHTHPLIQHLLSTLHTFHTIGYSLTRSLSTHALRSRRPPVPSFTHDPHNPDGPLIPTADWESAFNTWLFNQSEMAQAAAHDFSVFLEAKDDVDATLKTCLIHFFGEESKGGRVQEEDLEWSLVWFEGWWKARRDVFVGLVGELVRRVGDAEVLRGKRREGGLGDVAELPVGVQVHLETALLPAAKVGREVCAEMKKVKVDSEIDELIGLYSYNKDNSAQAGTDAISTATAVPLTHDLLRNIEKELAMLEQQEQLQHQDSTNNGHNNDHNNDSDLDAKGEPDDEYLPTHNTTHTLEGSQLGQELSDDDTPIFHPHKRLKLAQPPSASHEDVGSNEVVEVPMLLPASLFSDIGSRMNMDVDVGVDVIGISSMGMLPYPLIAAPGAVEDDFDDVFGPVREDAADGRGKARGNPLGDEAVWWK